MAQITQEAVNVRAGQSVGFEPLCQLGKGDEVVVIDRSYSWYKIRLPKDAKSFISKKYVSLLDDQRGVVIGDHVNIRAGAGIHYTVLGQLKQGSEVTLLEEVEDWYKIVPAEGTFGWISDQFAAFQSKMQPQMKEAITLPQEGLSPTQDKIAEPPTLLGTTEGKPVGVISVTGYLEFYNDTESGNISYQLLINDQPAYYIQGPQYILNQFLHYKVELEGRVDTAFQDRYPCPVILISKIQFVL